MYHTLHWNNSLYNECKVICFCNSYLANVARYMYVYTAYNISLWNYVLVVVFTTCLVYTTIDVAFLSPLVPVTHEHITINILQSHCLINFQIMHLLQTKRTCYLMWLYNLLTLFLLLNCIYFNAIHRSNVVACLTLVLPFILCYCMV